MFVNRTVSLAFDQFCSRDEANDDLTISCTNIFVPPGNWIEIAASTYSGVPPKSIDLSA